MNEHGQTPVVEMPAARDTRYALRGDFLEVCDCFSVCPCWTGRAPDDDVCTGVFAWVIAEGMIDGIDVTGQTAVSISTHEGDRDHARQRVLLFVGEGASNAQAAVLAAVFSGRFGGPLGELATLLGELLGIERAKIDVEWGMRRTRLTVGRRILADATSTIGATGRVTTLSDARLSGVLGSPAEVGVTRRFKVGLPGHGIDFDLRGRSAMRGHFSYRNDPPAA